MSSQKSEAKLKFPAFTITDEWGREIIFSYEPKEDKFTRTERVTQVFTGYTPFETKTVLPIVYGRNLVKHCNENGFSITLTKD